MKLKYTLACAFILGVTFSCTDEFQKMNVNTKLAPAGSVPPSMLVTNAEKNLVDIMTTPNVNSNIFRLLSQQWAETTYTDESRYDISTRNITQNFWDPFYRDILRDLKEAKDLINGDKLFTDVKLKANQLAVIDILQVYAFSILVNTYGDIPYKEALDFNNLQPKYESAASIYDDLVTRLNADMAALDNTSETIGEQDLFYEGDVDSWKTFANSLKLRMGLTLADADNAKAKGIVESAFASPNGLILDNTQNVTLTYLDAPPNTNPVWVNLVQSGRKDFVISNALLLNPSVNGGAAGPTNLGLLSVRNDPRIPAFVTTPYAGGVYGKSNSYNNFAKPDGTTVTAMTVPGVLMDAAEINFDLAEAAARGYSVGNTAKFYYDEGISQSFQYWGLTAGDAAIYGATPLVDYATLIATQTYKQVIGTQKYLAAFNRGHEAWVEYRRLDFPVLQPASSFTPLGPFPSRYSYPVGEQNLNTANFNAAAAAMPGGDVVTNKVFWDKF